MKHPIDKYFRDRLKDQSFDFDYSDWEKALELIDPPKKHKKTMPLWWGLAAILILIVGSLWMVYSSNIKKEQQAIKSEQEPISHRTSKRDAQIADADKKTAIHIRQENDKQNTNGTSSNPLNKTQTKQVEHKETSSDQIPKTSLQHSFSEMPNAHSREEFSTDKNQNSSSNQMPYHQKAETSTVLAPIEQKSTATGWSMKDKQTETLASLSMQELPVVSELDAKSVTILELNNDLSPKFVPIINGIALYGGISLYPYATTDTKTYRGEFLGINVRQQVLGAFNVRSGVGLNYINGSFGISQSTQVITRNGGFSWEKEVISLQPHGVYYLQVPLAIEWQKNRHHLATGIIANKTLSVRAKKIQDTYRSEDLIGTTTGQITPRATRLEEVWMTQTAFSNVFWQWDISYNYQLSSIWNIGLGMRYGLNSMTSNEAIGLLKEVKPVMIQLSTEINLWR